MKLQVRRNQRDGIGVFALIVGFLLGAGLMVIAAPKTGNQTVVSQSRSALGSGAGDATGGGVDSGVPTDAANDPLASAQAGAATASRSGANASTGSRSSGASGAGPEASSARGVTASTVRIGIAYPDLTALKALGPAYDNGDVPAQWRALLDGWKRDKRVPVNGRNVEFVFRSYNVVDTGSQRSTCSGFVQDDKVFAVVGVAYFQVGSECVAREFRTPLITSDGPTEAAFARAGGNLFSLYPSQDSTLRNWARFAADRGLVGGKTIGIYYLTSGDSPALSKVLEAQLKKYNASRVVFASTDQSLGGPNDALAAHRFQAEGVQTAFLLTSMTGFMQQAEQQRYRPAYTASDYDFRTSDAGMSTAPPAQFDSDFGITVTHNGEHAAGMAPPAATTACLHNYQRETGQQPSPPGSAEYAYILLSCDFGNTLLHTLNTAGRNLTPESFVAAMETYHSTETSQAGGIAFSKTRHSGADRMRTMQWHSDCTCWKAIGGFYPLLVP